MINVLSIFWYLYYDRFLELDKQNLLNQKFWIIKKRNPHQVVILKKKNSLCKHDSALLKLEAQKTAGNRNRGIEQVRFFLLVLLFCVPWAITRIMVFSLKSSIRIFFYCSDISKFIIYLQYTLIISRITFNKMCPDLDSIPSKTHTYMRWRRPPIKDGKNFFLLPCNFMFAHLFIYERYMGSADLL
jgi:hypothetical protein